jgi:hypothetical protein
MTQKHVVHGHEMSEHALFANLSIRALVITGIGLIIIAAVILAYIMPVIESTSEASTTSPALYTHALEMQYAKPWLDVQRSPATVLEYTNALELAYAQPWLDAHKTIKSSASNALEMQYAQPWLDKQKISTATLNYSNALEMQYAKPWLGTPSLVEYNNALEMLYANPWLLNSEFNICHSRMDYAYACRTGRWIPEK